MSDTADHQYKLSRQAFNAETSGRLRSAANDYRRAILLDKTNPFPYIYLGYVLKKMGEDEAAVQAYSLAADINPRVIDAWHDSGVSEDIKLRSHDANDTVRSHFTLLHRTAVTEYHRHHPDAALERIYEAVWCTTHDKAFSFKSEQQRPHLFYVPDLAPVAIFDSCRYPWCAEMEAAYEDIREEYLEVSVNPDVVGVPYIDADFSVPDESWQPLAGSMNWTSLHLYKNDQRDVKLIELLPKTCAVLERVPLLKTQGQPREVLFSVLKGQQHIPPHYGLANTDMTVHLPLITSDQAAIKVVDHVHHWRAGEIFMFDDAYLHESWNNFDEPRITLLFGAWHPDLSIDEQHAVSASFECREAWVRSRSI